MINGRKKLLEVGYHQSMHGKEILLEVGKQVYVK